MRILFLHEVNYLTKPIFEMHEFPEHLAKLGHEVGFVHFPEGFSLSQVMDLGWRKRVKGRVDEGISLDLYTPWTLGGGLVGRLFTAGCIIWQFSRILRDFRPDIVVSYAVPTSGWQSLVASHCAGVPYLFRALDVSHLIRKGPFSQIVKAAEEFVYRNADWVSANNPAMLEYCVGFGADVGRASTDLPPLDLSHFSESKPDLGDLRRKLGIQVLDVVILYMGSFFYFSGLPEVIGSMVGREPNIKLVLVGGGEQDAELRELVSRLGLQETVKFAGFINFEELPGFLKLADVAINAMHPSLVSNTAFPNKVIQYLAAGTPVVSTRLKGLEMTFTQSPALVFVESPYEVVSTAVNLAKSNGSASLELQALELVKDRFDLADNVGRFEHRIGRVAGLGA